MKNLFDYANHELSQDAFLRWLFENHDETDAGEDVRFFSDGLLRYLCALPTLGEIRIITARAQLKHLDVVADFTYEGQDYHLAIEDKNDARLYNDLAKYDSEFQRAKPTGTRRAVIYKTGYSSQEEHDKADACHWPFYDLDDLMDEFQSLGEKVPPKDEILTNYLRHLAVLHAFLSPKSSLADVFAIPHDDKHRAGKAMIARLSQKEYPNFVSSTHAWGGKYYSLGLEVASVQGVIPTIEFKDCDCRTDQGQIHVLLLIQAWNCNELDPEKADRKRCKKRLINPKLVYGLQKKIAQVASSDIAFLNGKLIAQKQPKTINNLVWKFEYVCPGEHLSEKEIEKILRSFSAFYYRIIDDYQNNR
jgi:hypothetical protein